LTSWGRSGHEQVVAGRPAAAATGGRIEYDWGGAIREWFVNDTRGLEQGWTVLDPPQNESSEDNPVQPGLSLTLTVRGGLTPQLDHGSSGLTFFDQQGMATLTYGGLKAWDAEGRALEARFVELPDTDPARVQIWVDDRQARYPVTIDPIAQQVYLKQGFSFYWHS